MWRGEISVCYPRTWLIRLDFYELGHGKELAAP
jgi:hypothetical protein